MNIIHYTLIGLWFCFGFIAWGFQDGYMTWKHPKQRKIKVDILFIVFDLILGPAAFVSTFIILGFKHWTRKFWSKNKKDGWDMLEKLESSTD